MVIVLLIIMMLTHDAFKWEVNMSGPKILSLITVIFWDSIGMLKNS